MPTLEIQLDLYSTSLNEYSFIAYESIFLIVIQYSNYTDLVHSP